MGSRRAKGNDGSNQVATSQPGGTTAYIMTLPTQAGAKLDNLSF